MPNARTDGQEKEFMELQAESAGLFLLIPLDLIASLLLSQPRAYYVRFSRMMRSEQWPLRTYPTEGRAMEN